MKNAPRKPLSELEHMVMDCLWSRGGSATSDEVREALTPRRVLADSTVRTILRRLEAKGYISHKAAGRGHIYFGVAPQRVAVGAIRQIIDRFCSGSVEQLVLGMVENEILDSRELQRLSRVVAQREKGKV